MSTGRSGHSYARVVTSRTAPSLLESSSSGHAIRKLRCAAFAADDAREVLAHGAERARSQRAATAHRDRDVLERRQPQRHAHAATERVRVAPHAPDAPRAHRQDLGDRRAVGFEQLLDRVRAQPSLDRGQVLRVGRAVGGRHLVGPPRSLDRDAVELLDPRPPLRRRDDDHGPLRAFRRTAGARLGLDRADVGVGLVERGGE